MQLTTSSKWTNITKFTSLWSTLVKSTPFTSTIWSPTYMVRHTSRYVASGHQRFIEKFWSFLCCHLKSDFSREGAWFDITDVDSRFLGGTTGDADAHTLGAHQAEEHLLLLDFFASDWGQACNAAFFLLRRVREKSKLHTLLVAMMQNPRKEGKSVTVSHPRLRHKLVHKLPLQRFVWRAAAMHKSKWEQWSLHRNLTSLFIITLPFHWDHPHIWTEGEK